MWEILYFLITRKKKKIYFKIHFFLLYLYSTHLMYFNMSVMYFNMFFIKEIKKNS